MDNTAFIVINIVAIIFSPIAAVVITQRLQNRAKWHENKLNVFKTFMADELGYKGKITWVTVQNSYVPKGFTDYLNNEARINEAKAKIAQLVDVAMTMLLKST